MIAAPNKMDFAITFNDEAGESMHKAIEALSGLIVQITPNDGQPNFDALLVGTDPENDLWTAIVVQVQDGDGRLVGPQFTVIADEICVL